MARWQRTIDIASPPARIWDVMADVEAWPEWTASIQSVETTAPSAFGLGSEAMVKAKGVPKSRFRVTRWEPGRGFDWETKSMGATSIGGHWIEPAAGGSSMVTLSVEVHSPLAAILRPLIGSGIRRNLEMEANGLKQRSEELQRAAVSTAE